MGTIDFAASARLILSSIEDAAVTLGVVLPVRRYIGAGGAVYDCEQVVVSSISSQTGLVDPTGAPVAAIGNCNVIWNTTFEAAIVICSAEKVAGPRGAVLPTAEQMTTDADNIDKMTDVLGAAITAIAESGVVGNLTASVAYGAPQGTLIAAVATVTLNAWVV